MPMPWPKPEPKIVNPAGTVTGSAPCADVSEPPKRQIEMPMVKKGLRALDMISRFVGEEDF